MTNAHPLPWLAAGLSLLTSAGLLRGVTAGDLLVPAVWCGLDDGLGLGDRLGLGDVGTAVGAAVACEGATGAVLVGAGAGTEETCET